MNTYKVNQQISRLPIIFLSTSLLKTKTGKPYITGELYDGSVRMQYNAWNWTADAPAQNTVYTISGSVTVYAGNLQINITELDLAPDVDISYFRPSWPVDLADVKEDCVTTISCCVKDDYLRALAIKALDDPRWLTTPAAVSVHHAFNGGVLVHSRDVMHLADSIGQSAADLAWRDLLLVGGLLHDIGKLDGYAFDVVTPVMTTEGTLEEHAILGCAAIDKLHEDLQVNFDKDSLRCKKTKILLKHIIASHHDKQEYGAAAVPQCIEAHIVSMADCINARIQMIAEASNDTDDVYTKKIWALGNRQHINCLELEKWLNTEQ